MERNNVCRFCGQILMDGSECNCFGACAQIIRADLVAEKKINSATLVFPPNVKAKITRGSGGKVKIERSEVRATKQEVEG